MTVTVRRLFWDSIHPPLKKQEKTRPGTRTRTPRPATLLFWAPFLRTALRSLGGSSERWSPESLCSVQILDQLEVWRSLRWDMFAFTERHSAHLDEG